MKCPAVPLALTPMRYEFRWSAVSDNELKHRGLPASRYYCVIKSFCHRASLDDTEINIDTKVESIHSFTVAITFVDDILALCALCKPVDYYFSGL